MLHLTNGGQSSYSDLPNKGSSTSLRISSFGYFMYGGYSRSVRSVGFELGHISCFTYIGISHYSRDFPFYGEIIISPYGVSIVRVVYPLSIGPSYGCRVGFQVTQGGSQTGRTRVRSGVSQVVGVVSCV